MNKIKRFDFSTAERGQEITKEVYDHFLNVLPPIFLNGGQGWAAGYQLGEPYDHSIDTRTGKWRALFATFTSCDSKYYFQGYNFVGEIDSRSHSEKECL